VALGGERRRRPGGNMLKDTGRRRPTFCGHSRWQRLQSRQRLQPVACVPRPPWHWKESERRTWAQCGPNARDWPSRNACMRSAATSTLAGDAQTDPADLGVKGSRVQISPARPKQSTPPDLVGPAFDRHSLPEALGQQHGQVVEEEMVELGRLRKGAVGRAVSSGSQASICSSRGSISGAGRLT
jgi:hypothetical protein